MKKYNLCLLVLTILLFTACSKEDDVPGNLRSDNFERTLIMYIVADTDISRSLFGGLMQMYDGITPSMLKDNRLVIFWDGPQISGTTPTQQIAVSRPSTPQLFEVFFDSNNQLTERIVWESGEQLNSADSEVLGLVIDKIFREFPSEDYGIIFSSHAMGWLPQDRTRSFGRDGTDEMDIPDLGSVIPDGSMKYIVFDACYMGAVEVAYELRNKTEWFLGSPTEIMDTGMPYQHLAGILFQREPDWSRYVDLYYDYYENSYGSTLSVVKSSELENLAASVRDILYELDWSTAELIPDALLQCFDRLTPHYFFDLGNYVAQPQVAATSAQLEAFDNAIRRAVPYYRYSDVFFSTVQIDEYCGLSTYVPRSNVIDKVSDFYSAYAWYGAVYQ